MFTKNWLTRGITAAVIIAFSGCSSNNTTRDVLLGTAAVGAGVLAYKYATKNKTEQAEATPPQDKMWRGGYKLVRDGSNKCLDRSGDSLLLWDCHGKENQRFIFDQESLKVQGQCADIYGGNVREGEAVGVYGCHGKANQRWTYDNKSRLIRISGTNVCLDSQGNGNDYKIVTANCNRWGVARWNLQN
jgi:hypothetical protein